MIPGLDTRVKMGIVQSSAISGLPTLEAQIGKVVRAF